MPCSMQGGSASVKATFMRSFRHCSAYTGTPTCKLIKASSAGDPRQKTAQTKQQRWWTAARLGMAAGLAQAYERHHKLLRLALRQWPVRVVGCRARQKRQRQHVARLVGTHLQIH